MSLHDLGSAVRLSHSQSSGHVIDESNTALRLPFDPTILLQTEYRCSVALLLLVGGNLQLWIEMIKIGPCGDTIKIFTLIGVGITVNV